MTRINLGVDPSELCDQHLIAEYKELPRVFNCSGFVPGPFRLGRGHVLWCSQFYGTMADRYKLLVCEMRYRGFTVNYPNPKVNDGNRVNHKDIRYARKIIIDRINEKLINMRPRWTRRRAPDWAMINRS